MNLNITNQTDLIWHGCLLFGICLIVNEISCRILGSLNNHCAPIFVLTETMFDNFVFVLKQSDKSWQVNLRDIFIMIFCYWFHFVRIFESFEFNSLVKISSKAVLIEEFCGSWFCVSIQLVVVFQKFNKTSLVWMQFL